MLLFELSRENLLEQYIARIAEGDTSALASLYDETRKSVFGFTVSLIKSAHDAEDITHDTYMRIWSSAGSYSPQGKPMAWILTVARNLAMSELRRRSSFPVTIDGDESLPEHLYREDDPNVTAEDRIVLDAALSLLSDEERSIIILHAVSGLKHRDIASLLSFPLSTVLSKYRRARMKLHDVLFEHYPDTGK